MNVYFRCVGVPGVRDEFRDCRNGSPGVHLHAEVLHDVSGDGKDDPSGVRPGRRICSCLPAFGACLLAMAIAPPFTRRSSPDRMLCQERVTDIGQAAGFGGTCLLPREEQAQAST